jgi:hypothetical protein
MSGDPMKLVKFVCVAKSHAGGRSDAALTIHQGLWAFCPAGAAHPGHDWQPSDGLPLADAMRFTPREAPEPVRSGPAGTTKPAPPPAPATRRRATHADRPSSGR